MALKLCPLTPPLSSDWPAHGETRAGRFHNVTELRLAGLDLTDVSSRLLVRFVPHLTRLDLSQCGSITDQTVHTLTSPISPLRDTLVYLNLAGERLFLSLPVHVQASRPTRVCVSGCVKVTEQCLPLLRRCSSLQTVDLRSCSLLSSETGQLLSFSSSSSSLATVLAVSSATVSTSSCPPEDRTLLKSS